MAEYRYGYRTEFDKPVPVGQYDDPQFYKPTARVTASNPQVAKLRSKLPSKDPTISFNIGLQENPGSVVSKAIGQKELFLAVPGANPAKKPPDSGRIAVTFPKGALPKLQSFKSAMHSKGQYLLLVGGRLAGMHPFGGSGFVQNLQSYVLFVVDTKNYQTVAAALPETYYQTVGLMNGQSYQLTHGGKNYLFLVGGYGYSETAKPKPTMVTFNTMTVIDVDKVIENINAAAGNGQVPDIGSNIMQAHHDDLQVTGGELLFNPASNEPIVKEDCFYLVVGQIYHGAYASGVEPNPYSYTRSMRKFQVPYPNADGSLPSIIVTEIRASKETTEAHDPEAMTAQLARRDLNVVPSLLPSTFTNGKGYVGAVIFSGVFNQDGSDAPYLQPLLINFNPNLTAQGSANPKKIPMYTSASFFQLFNNYNCPNIQLFSAEQGVMYHVLLGGVSYFYVPKDSSALGYGIDQVADIFQVPFTTDVSIVKMDNSGNFSQRLSPPSKDFFQQTGLTAFGAEGLFMRNPETTLSSAFINDSTQEIIDLDCIMSQWVPPYNPYKLGTIYGGIESTQAQKGSPRFDAAETDAASRLIDVYITRSSN